MLDNLSNKLQGIFTGLRSKGRLTEEDINLAMREIRMALLEADVNFMVVKDFVKSTKERCMTAEVLDSLSPAQNVFKIVLDELTKLLGGESAKFDFSSRIPNVIMMVGLQGSGKTTASAKLAYLMKKQNHSPLLAACDVYRPAAIDQLETLGKEIDVKVYRSESKDPVQIAKEAIQEAIDSMRDVVIIDTAGRLHVDEDMMSEAEAIRDAVQPERIYMVVDAMTGQDVVNVAQAFAERVDFDGVIMSKMDGDARGGGALSIRQVTGKSIMYISSGEKPDSLEVFHPDRMAKRILGMGDVLSFIENAVANAEAKVEDDEATRLATGKLNLNDFVEINRKIQKMGGIQKMVASLPGGDKALASGKLDTKALDRMEVIISSMTEEERLKPEVLNGSRRLRIAKGAGVTVTDVNHMMKKFAETKKMLKRNMNGMLEGRTTTKNKKGKKGRNKRRGMSIPGMGGMSMSDLKNLQEMMDK